MVYIYLPHPIYVSVLSEFISSIQGEQDEVGVGAPTPSGVSVVTSQQFLCGPIHARFHLLPVIVETEFREFSPTHFRSGTRPLAHIDVDSIVWLVASGLYGSAFSMKGVVYEPRLTAAG